MTKKRPLKLYIYIAAFVVILVFVFCPLQWTVAKATDSSGWKLTVRKIPYGKLGYIMNCILDFTTSPTLEEYYYKCTLSRRGRTVSSRTFTWPSYHPRNIRIAFLDTMPDNNRTVDIQFDTAFKVRCSWSHDQTVWKEIHHIFQGVKPGMSLINPNKTRDNDEGL
jgi:hypothetical protein